MNGFCAVSFALLGSSITTMLLMNKLYMKKFEASLDETQKEIYQEIKEERLFIFVVATVIGTIVGFIVAMKNVCMGVAIALTLQTMIYLICPKTKYMLEHVNKPEQSKLWIKKYKHMSLLGYIGIVLGLLVYLIQFKMKEN
jgi:hypothetical protein